MGLWDQQPNIYNAVPRSVRLDVDIRDSDKARRDSVIERSLRAAEDIAAKRKCGHTKEVMFEYPVAISNPRVGRLFYFVVNRYSSKLAAACTRACMPAYAHSKSFFIFQMTSESLWQPKHNMKIRNFLGHPK